MMDFVWRLNAACNSAFEVKALCRDFLQRKRELQELRRSFSENMDTNAARSDYLEGEIRRTLESLNDLGKTVQELIDVLNLDGDANNA